MEKVLRCPIPRIPSRRSSGPTLTNRVRRTQLLPHIIGQASNYLRCRTFVVLDILARPPGKGNAGLEGIEGKAASVEPACSRGGEKGCGDDATRGLIQVGKTSAWDFDDGG